MTISLSRGANAPVPSGVSRVRVMFESVSGPALDGCALLLTEAGKVRDAADFVFYNQPASVDGSVRHLGRTARADSVEVNLDRIVPQIATVALVTSADGARFGLITGLALRALDDGGNELLRVDIATATVETAFVLGEFYRRAGAWKFRAVGQGWATGLAGLATDYGISVDDEPGRPMASQPAAPQAVPAPPVTSPVPAPKVNTTKAVRLRKQLAAQPPSMVNLAKQAGVSLDAHGLGDHRARVALCLDISASMTRLLRHGRARRGPIDLRNYHGWVEGLVRRRRLENGTHYNKAMKAVRRHYFPDGRGGKQTSPRPDNRPVYVMFVTDGHTSDRKGTRDQVAWSSYEPLFWQFMAIGKTRRPDGAPSSAHPKSPSGAGCGGFMARLAAAISMDFSFLEELDEMGGRYLDNASFFSVSDPAELSDEQLYESMMTEYPSWLRQATDLRLLHGS
ncbi:TerD family protein [Frankia sp. AgB32]|uniref:TerD family protein n=1 Tax=Frankia sp. AgB32 TaxID=631119 RepID=UPI00200BAB6B|nr:TerD family protein [Frankia sp. AgB32]MCK9896911.1 TerD family protein [Frankia sp. AgB32]